MKDLNGKVVVLTGAASGIGRALAQALAGEGAILELADKNEGGLAETAALIGGSADVETAVLDVSDRDGFDAWAADILTRRGHVDVVINNAGVALAALGTDMSHEDLEWLMGINFWGVVYGTRSFLPQMLARDSGHIVNVSSVFGLFGVRAQSAYCAAKFAVRGYSDSIRVELDGTGVRMTVVHPGGIKTNIARAARVRFQGEDAPSPDDLAANFDKAAKTTPDKAAQVILNGIKKDKARVLIGTDAKIIDILQRLIPARFPIMLGRRAGGLASSAKS